MLALSVPFAQCLFELAIRTSGSERDAGFVGQITSNSFMKREFGKKLIENFFPTRHLTHVIDTSGAYIPGHGTPTVILIGRNHIGRADEPIRAVLGIRGEPAQPEDPARGFVWMAIVNQVGKPESESEWISVENSTRNSFSAHPWSLGGGGAGRVQESIEQAVAERLSSIANSIGFGVVTRTDDAYLLGDGALRRAGIEASLRRAMVDGESTRDWSAIDPDVALWPYDEKSPALSAKSTPSVERLLWPHRVLLRERVAYGKTQLERGLEWFEYSMFFAHRYGGLTLAFACVSTHNHFVLDRGGRIFNRHAPVIKLHEGMSEDNHQALLGVLNSSTACFWLKQVCHDKGSQGVNEGFKSQEWERFFEFTGTKLQEFPLPAQLPLQLGQALDSLSQRLTEEEPSLACRESAPSRASLDVAKAEHECIRGRMIGLQEELDWRVYGLYDLLSNNEIAQLTAPNLDDVPQVKLGERSFEIVLARKVGADETVPEWFTRHGSTPITEIPRHWPEWYQKIVQARIDIIEKRKDIALIERPECKRRWATEPWEKKEAEALRTWLLDRCENEELWFALRDGIKQPRTLTVSQLADQFRTDTDMNSVAQLYANDHLGKRDLTLAQILEQVVADQHVPYLPALRYKESGLRIREQWEGVWKKQREEDRTGQRLDIAVPPKYGSKDFQKTSYWSQRGKLDVPKERFVSYPGANPDADPTLLLGWAGWDHKDQVQALVNVVNDRTEQAGWETTRLKPLLAGILELMPWVHQWYGEHDEEWGGKPAEEYQTYLDTQRAKHQLTENDLRDWRPEAKKRGRQRGKKDDQQ